MLGVSVLLAGLVGFRVPISVGWGTSPSITIPDDTAPSPATPSRPRTKNIEDVRLGERTAGRNPLRAEVDDGLAEPNPETWRALQLRMRKYNGGVLRIGLLRPLGWIATLEAKEGGTIWLNLPEMGAVGSAEVLSIGPCPPIQPGVGNVVTGTFHHEAGDVVDLFVEGAEEQLGCTANHRYWSEDRQEYVAAGELRPGERLRSRTMGHTRVVSRVPRAHPEPVYNLEVHGEHVFEVSEAGVLVHNSCHKFVPNRGVGKYSQVGGHHIHAKAAFKNATQYSKSEGFSISQKYMKSLGLDHQAMTNKQRELFNELARSGRPNTLKEHTRIAVEALESAGMTRAEARKLVADSLRNLREQGARLPASIPWN